MEQSIESIKAHYNFTSRDVENLRAIWPIVESHREKFPAAFYNFIKGFEDTAKFLKDEEVISRHQEALKRWFTNLFSGDYGGMYLRELQRVGLVHVEIKLQAHYVNASMHFVKDFIFCILDDAVRDAEERDYLKGSVGKILDINLDIMTSSFIVEEKKAHILPAKVEGLLIQFARRASYGMNLVLVLGLVGLGIMVLGLFTYDVTHILEGNIEKGILTTLGSLLMLWVVIELMETEIRHLKGGRFAIKVFVSVALVAVIRKILVSSLSTEQGSIETQLALIAAVAVLGAVYWLVAKVDDNRD